MANILVAGGTGLVGSALTKMLVEKSHQVVILSRSPSRQVAGSNPSIAQWNPASGTIDIDAIQNADYIINLAGAGVADKRWTSTRKREIVESRVQSGQLITRVLKEISHSVKAVINASATGWYGPDPANVKTFHGFSETDPAFNDFLGQTCLQWEQSIDPVLESGIRLVKLRIGIVLSNDGGALKEFKKPLQFGIAGILGNGKQVISWIHIEDLCRIFLHVMENEQCEGVYNAVAPAPVSNRALTLQLAKKMRGNFYIALQVPAIALRIIAGGVSVEVLKSTRVKSVKISSTGFQFKYPDIGSALKQLI